MAALRESGATYIDTHSDEIFLWVAVALAFASIAMTMAWGLRGIAAAFFLPFAVAGLLWFVTLGWDYAVLGDRSDSARYGFGVGLVTYGWIAILWCIPTGIGALGGLVARSNGP